MTYQPVIKICGITLADDAAQASAAGADFIGLNFWPRSKRYLDPARAPLVAAAARGAGAAKLVGVFVDPELDEVLAVTSQVDLDVIQLHGDESPDDVDQIAAATKRAVWKAIAVRGPADLEHLDVWHTAAFLLDAPSPARGGTGTKIDWQVARDGLTRNASRKFVLAGGLDPSNVQTAVATVQPWGVDVASGVEAGPGIKDPAKVTAFIAAARAGSR